MTSLAGLVYPINALPAARLLDKGIDVISHDPDAKFEAVRRYYERVDADLLFFFSDIVIQAEALGATLAYGPSSMPRVAARADMLPERTVSSPRMRGNAEVVTRLKAAFPGKPVAAMVYGPFTVAGQAAGEEVLMRACLREPALARAWVDTALDAAADYARLLLDAGADLLWISDPFAGLLSPERFPEFAGEALGSLFTTFSGTPSALHICGDTSRLLALILATGAGGVSFDQAMDLLSVEDAMPRGRAIIGNTDPLAVAEALSPSTVGEDVDSLVRTMGIHPDFSLSTGCALPPSTPVENAAAFVDAGHAAMLLLARHAALLHPLAATVERGEHATVPGLVETCMDAGVDPLTILESGLMRAVRKQSALHESGKSHLADILLMADALNAGMSRLGPHLPQTKASGPLMVLGTAAGDHHAIGKDVLAAVLKAQGIPVLDLGVDVSPQRFVKALEQTGAPLAGVSAFTSQARAALPSIVNAIRTGLATPVGVVIGGAAASQACVASVGADAYAKDAAGAVRVVKALLARLGTSA